MTSAKQFIRESRVQIIYTVEAFCVTTITYQGFFQKFLEEGEDQLIGTLQTSQMCGTTLEIMDVGCLIMYIIIYM